MRTALSQSGSSDSSVMDNMDYLMTPSVEQSPYPGTTTGLYEDNFLPGWDMYSDPDGQESNSYELYNESFSTTQHMATSLRTISPLGLGPPTVGEEKSTMSQMSRFKNSKPLLDATVLPRPLPTLNLTYDFSYMYGNHEQAGMGGDNSAPATSVDAQSPSSPSLALSSAASFPQGTPVKSEKGRSASDTDGDSNIGSESKAVAKPSAKKFYCKNPQCHNIGFTRKADRQRHQQNVHAEDEAKENHWCDYGNCSRHTTPFTRKDHFREHLREYHLEDILKMGSNGRHSLGKSSYPLRHKVERHQSHGKYSSRETGDKSKSSQIKAWLELRHADHKWWRCMKCLERVYLDENEWQCPRCQTCIDETRKEVRLAKAARNLLVEGQASIVN